jgi:hypothetical protein
MAEFILGFVLGLIAAPVLRSWIVWREYQASSRQAWLADETLKRLEDATHPRDGDEPAPDSVRNPLWQ